MAIKYTKELRDARELIETLNYRISLLEDAFKRTEQLEFQQWLKAKGHRKPIGNTRTNIRLKLFNLEHLRDSTQQEIDDYCKKRKQKIITDCYSIIDRDTVNIFIYVNRTVKERKLFSYPYRGIDYFDAAQFIDKTLEEAEEIIQAKFQSKEK